MIVVDQRKFELVDFFILKRMRELASIDPMNSGWSE